ncbi:response regulator [Candidatus Uhrbacteria bacterium CG22_combo_CG10-13_8_21_14_all_47_17]|uniref:Response regulator n=1 Tax=Candidatus Uhrbacteria bacterium CG22_combo_CG10-13_8_21_14_all_47_17 TaxID=1975041 RepID=A0A2H0BS51_9BACT|nr:MAG: response regulator [Candidatus Uhrbacteria bacterium CG22_combo_CG10-13_8_21_14_all_47_17]
MSSLQEAHCQTHINLVPWSYCMTVKAGKTVLVVEDDNFLIKAYEAHLAKAGFHVRTALDGVEAVESLKKVMPDIILLDLVMPRMDGFDVLEDMQKKSEWKKIPIVVVSNLGQESDRDRSLKLGAVEYIVKSDFSLQQTVDLISKHLKK